MSSIFEFVVFLFMGINGCDWAFGVGGFEGIFGGRLDWFCLIGVYRRSSAALTFFWKVAFENQNIIAADKRLMNADIEGFWIGFV